MPELEVRIVRLEPMRVASVRAFGESPEREAWDRLRHWAEPRGLLADLDRNPVYGFNNPNPEPDRTEYGYEFWVAVTPDVEGAGGVEIKDFAGGLYAVTRCRLLDDPNGSMPEVWRKLLEWVRLNDYEWRRTHELEKPLDPWAAEQDYLVELYLPIEE